jgi:Amt family ammonium transporter
VSFKAYVIFALLWSTLVYDPIAHWVWGTGGWLHALGALDFAGGTVVHISSGVSALIAAILIGRRLKTSEPHDATMTILGASLLWFGWFGFNAGSALAAGALATSAFVVTNTAAAMAGLTWLTVSWLHKGRPSVLGMAAGAVAGLVAITPASGFVDVSGSIIIGLGAGVFCYVALQLRPRLKVDDALDVWAVHGIGGTWGAIATGLFATVAINTAGANGLFFGNPQQLVTQLIAVGATWLYAAVATFVIVKAIDLTIGMRVREHEETLGLDASQHGEIAYQLD